MVVDPLYEGITLDGAMGKKSSSLENQVKYVVRSCFYNLFGKSLNTKLNVVTMIRCEMIVKIEIEHF